MAPGKRAASVYIILDLEDDLVSIIEGVEDSHPDGKYRIRTRNNKIRALHMFAIYQGPGPSKFLLVPNTS